jgi:hypothetical protein
MYYSFCLFASKHDWLKILGLWGKQSAFSNTKTGSRSSSKKSGKMVKWTMASIAGIVMVPKNNVDLEPDYPLTV